MKKILAAIFASILTLSSAAFAQTAVIEKNLAKTLEKNKDASASFSCEMNLGAMTITADGNVIIPLLEKSKAKIVFGMDRFAIEERIAYAGNNQTVTFTAKDIASKTYQITKISGIETVEQYKDRLAKEQRKKSLKEVTKFPVQVVTQEAINLQEMEAAWLPGQIQDKLKSNLQEYLGMKTVVDSKSETALKKLQAESENASRNEKTAIEIGKITTAKYAIFIKLRRTASGYTLNADFTDLTTGEQLASAASKEYSKPEYLYGTTGAVDEITLAMATKLEIEISSLKKSVLSLGSAGFSVEDQIALARQNEENFKKMVNEYDAELRKLDASSDINAIQNKSRIEAEKALLFEKQNAERKRQEELRAQKERSEADSKLEAERSIALKTQRDQLAKDAAEKAAEVRKMKLEQQGVLGQISVLESKKKALVEIRQSVENRSKELWNELLKSRETEETKIRNRPLGTSEKDANGNQTPQSKQRREKQVERSYQEVTNKFFEDCASVKEATMPQQNALISEIRADQKNLKEVKTVSSMGSELKVSYGRFDGSKNGWVAYISLYSDGIRIYSDTFIVNYEAISGKKTPTEEQLLDFAVADEYDYNIDMYNSLLTRGSPIVYFEIDYSVDDAMENYPSTYEFNFNQIRVINTISGETTQTSSLKKHLVRKMSPEVDMRQKNGIVWAENQLLSEFLNLTFSKSVADAKKQIAILRPYVLEGNSISQAYALDQNRLNQIKDLKNKIAAIENQIFGIEAQIPNQKGIAQRKRDELKQLEKSYSNALSDSTKGLLSDFLFNENHKPIRDRGDREMKRLEPLIEKKKKEISDVEQKIASLNSDISSKRSEISRIKNTISNLEK